MKASSKPNHTTFAGYASWMSYSKAELTTHGLTIRQAAIKANMSCTLGFENVWLDDVKTKYADAREVIGTKLLSLGNSIYV